MKFAQKSFDKKVLLVVLIVVIALGALMLLFGVHIRVWLGVNNSTGNDIPQSATMEASVAPVIALDPRNLAGAVAIGDLLKICPDEEIINKMPTLTPTQNPPSTYFILDGERRELSEFDMPWVAANCDVGEQPVY